MVADQPLILSTDVEEKMDLEDEEAGPRYNLRKLSELPYHLIRSEMWNEFVEVRINKFHDTSITKMHPREMQSEIKVINETIFKRMIVEDKFDLHENESVREHIFMSMVL